MDVPVYSVVGRASDPWRVVIARDRGLRGNRLRGGERFLRRLLQPCEDASILAEGCAVQVGDSDARAGEGNRAWT